MWLKAVGRRQRRVKWSFTRHWCKVLIAHLAHSATLYSVLRRRTSAITQSISRLRNCLFTLLGLPSALLPLPNGTQSAPNMKNETQDAKLQTPLAVAASWKSWCTSRHDQHKRQMKSWSNNCALADWDDAGRAPQAPGEKVGSCGVYTFSFGHVRSEDGPMFVQTTPSSAHTAAGFFSCSPGLWLCQRQMLPAQRAERADRCPHWPRDTSKTSSADAAASSSSPSSPSLSGLHQLRFAGQQRQRHNRCPFRYVFCALCGLRLCCFFWGQSSVASAGLLIYL